ncbi:integrator complex subunit 12-like isoform X1 [Chrysoperla carnea]|uniref:integrator complex subunit 12-like isoform X1 n=1 Tax=Chrysoperla carnea TaxID=189513 RepID=UPI001D067A25|nr:integrator complex subunit 12-like isoform X1 [Chrysoperla carnea]
MSSSSTDDAHINRVIELMHSKDESSYEELYKLLEEVIIKKYGNTRSLDNIRFKREVVPVAIETPVVSAPVPAKRRSQDDSGRNSDNELVFTLLKDDLTCVTCRDMDVSAGNQLIECNSCHALYHQECHTPYILDSELNTNWICSTCKYRARKASKHSSGSSSRNNGGSGSGSGSERHSSTSASKGGSSSSYSKVSGSPSNSSSGTSTSKQYSGTNKSSSHSSSSGTGTGTSTHSGSKSPSSNNSGSNSAQNNQRIVIPNINIVSASADKRLQIMKKKAAAKIQEKRKPKLT